MAVFWVYPGPGVELWYSSCLLLRIRACAVWTAMSWSLLQVRSVLVLVSLRVRWRVLVSVLYMGNAYRRLLTRPGFCPGPVPRSPTGQVGYPLSGRGATLVDSTVFPRVQLFPGPRVLRYHLHRAFLALLFFPISALVPPCTGMANLPRPIPSVLGL